MQMQICSAAGHTKAVPKKPPGKATAPPHRDPASTSEHLQVCFDISSQTTRRRKRGVDRGRVVGEGASM